MTTLYSFCAQLNCTDGGLPYDALVQATDGNLYGTTQSYGNPNCVGSDLACGTIFKITPAGTLTTLYSFCSQPPQCNDGYDSYSGLIQATSGILYGATSGGGTSGAGTVFSLSVGLKPFVKTLPAGGKVGANVVILGNNLTGSTSVTFNGTAASFTVVSPTEIKSIVPVGATSGKVEVITPHGALTSNVVFQVK